MTRLLISTDCFLPRWDGIARFLNDVVPVLKKHFDVEILAPDFGRSRIKAVKFPLFKVRFGDYFFCKPKLSVVKKYVRESDVVFNQSLGTVGLAVIFEARRQHKKLVCYVHSIDWELASQSIGRFRGLIRLVVRWYARVLYNKCDLLVVPSDMIRRVLVQNGVSVPMVVIPLGVDTRKFRPGNCKKRFGFADDEVVVGFVGRLGREKNLSVLYDAFNQLAGRLRLLVVGEGIEQPVVERAVFVGRQDNVVPFYQAMDVFVLPSLTETTSLTTMEAMACGLPVIATRVGAIPEYVEDGKNGLLVEPGDVRELKEKLEVLVDNPVIRRELGARARSCILKKYSIAKTSVQLVKVLSS